MAPRTIEIKNYLYSAHCVPLYGLVHIFAKYKSQEDLQTPVYTSNFCCDFMCYFPFLTNVNEWAVTIALLY